MPASSISESFQSCLQGDFFDKPIGPRLEKGSLQMKFVDKIFKAADPLLDTVGEIAKARGASEDTLKSIESGRTWFKTTRDCTALVNIFQGVKDRLIGQSQLIYKMGMSLYEGKESCEVRTNKHPLQTKIHDNTIQIVTEVTVETAEGRWEMVMVLISQIGKWIGSVTFIIGFGVCRPIANVEKHIYKPSKQSIAPVAHDIGAAFPTVMMVNHMAGVIGTGADMVYQYWAYDRDAIVVSSFNDRMIKNCAEMTEKILELLLDIFHHIGHQAPAGLRLPAGLIIGGIGIWKEWKEL